MNKLRKCKHVADIERWLMEKRGDGGVPISFACEAVRAAEMLGLLAINEELTADLTRARAVIDELVEALKTERAWNDDQLDSLSKMGFPQAYKWHELQHRERLEAIDAALAQFKGEKVDA